MRFKARLLTSCFTNLVGATRAGRAVTTGLILFANGAVMASPAVSFVSSSGVKEIASFGGNVEELVPAAVARRLKAMFPDGRAGAPLSEQE